MKKMKYVAAIALLGVIVISGCSSIGYSSKGFNYHCPDCRGVIDPTQTRAINMFSNLYYQAPIVEHVVCGECGKKWDHILDGSGQWAVWECKHPEHIHADWEKLGVIYPFEESMISDTMLYRLQNECRIHPEGYHSMCPLKRK